jgi:transcription-repair coupling factor (superfamily II helicase)
MYTELLNRAIRSLKTGRDITPEDIEADDATATEIDLHVPAVLPEDYLPDVHTRLIMYKRIANARSNEELYELQIEMIDRFGLLPDPAKMLLALTELKLLAAELGISEIRLGAGGGRLRFVEKPNIDPVGIITLIQSKPGRYRMEGPQVLNILSELDDAQERLEMVKALLDELGSYKLSA